MKITLLAATAVLAAGLVSAAPAAAQDRHDQNGDRHGQNMDRHNGDRHDMNGGRHDWRGGHRGWHRHCWWTWRHRHHVRVCR
jgi:hypothetical protein